MPETTASTPANAPTSGKPVKRILIQNGTLTGLYDDKIAPKLHKKLGGAAEITRASHVEAPLGKLDNIEFEVDLTPSGGPKIGGFTSYQAAVDAEIQWINENRLKA